MCSEFTPRARIPDTRIPQFMQPCFTIYKIIGSKGWDSFFCTYFIVFKEWGSFLVIFYCLKTLIFKAFTIFMCLYWDQCCFRRCTACSWWWTWGPGKWGVSDSSWPSPTSRWMITIMTRGWLVVDKIKQKKWKWKSESTSSSILRKRKSVNNLSS